MPVGQCNDEERLRHGWESSKASLGPVGKTIGDGVCTPLVMATVGTGAVGTHAEFIENKAPQVILTALSSGEWSGDEGRKDRGAWLSLLTLRYNINLFFLSHVQLVSIRSHVMRFIREVAVHEIFFQSYVQPFTRYKVYTRGGSALFFQSYVQPFTRYMVWQCTAGETWTGQ